MRMLGPSLRRKLLTFNYTGIMLLLGGATLWPSSLSGSASPPVPPALEEVIVQIVAHEQRRLQEDGRFAAFSLAPAALAAVLPEAAEAWSQVSGYYRITAAHAAGGGLHLHILPDPSALRAEQVAPIVYSVELTSAGAVKEAPWPSLRSEGSSQ